MKKTDESGLTFLLVLSIILLSQSAYAQPAPIVLEFDFPEPKIVEGPTYDNIAYDSVIMAGLDKHGEPGLPVLPFKTVRILIPQEGDLQDIEVIGEKKITLDGRYKIEYGQTPVPISSDLVIKTEPNQAVYLSIKPFPGVLFSQPARLQNFRGYKILLLNLHPVEYIPKEGLVSYFADMTVTVNLQPTLEISPLFRNLPKDKAEIIKMVDNPNEVNSYTEKVEAAHMRLYL